MSEKIKLISLNIELNRHYDRIFPFLKEEKPDVVCFQEVVERDMPLFIKELGMNGRFEPMVRAATNSSIRTGLDNLPIGLALFSRLPAEFKADYYAGQAGIIPEEREDNQGINLILLRANISVADRVFTIGTTHFTWTSDGEASDIQRNDLQRFFSALAHTPEIVFCGDFNAPRGREIWGEIAKKYNDNIPLEYKSSLDPVLHRAPNLQYVVDGLFSTPEYMCTDTWLECGVSDHCAIVSIIERNG